MPSRDAAERAAKRWAEIGLITEAFHLMGH